MKFKLLFRPTGLRWICPSALYSQPFSQCSLCSRFCVLFVHQTCHPCSILGSLTCAVPYVCLEGSPVTTELGLLHSGQLLREAFPHHCDLSSLPSPHEPLAPPSVVPLHSLPADCSLVRRPFCSLLVSHLRTRILPVISLISPMPQLVSGSQETLSETGSNEQVSSFCTVSHNECEVIQKNRDSH